MRVDSICGAVLINQSRDFYVHFVLLFLQGLPAGDA